MDRGVDVLVVGAGPAGCMAARTAAQAGASVWLVDRKSRVGSRPHCAEFVPRALGLEIDWPARSRVQGVDGMEVVLDGESVLVPGPGWILDRQVFDHALAVAAASAGAEVRADTTLTGRQDGRWVLERRGRTFLISAKAVVGADGASSRTARIAGRPPQISMPAVQVEAPLAAPLNRTLIFLDRRYRLGYGWVFPKGDTANVGLGSDGPDRLDALLDGFVGWLMDSGRIRAGALARTGGSLPVSGPRPPLAENGVFLAGDAAGLTHPVTGAGIPQAIASGMEAGRAAAAWAGGDTSAATRYQNEIMGRYGRFLDRGSAARRELDEHWNHDGLAAALGRAWLGKRATRR